MTSTTARPRPFNRTRLFLIATGLLTSATFAAAQTASTAADGSVPTPRPINPATNTSNPEHARRPAAESVSGQHTDAPHPMRR